jgi:hypothetical protein
MVLLVLACEDAREPSPGADGGRGGGGGGGAAGQSSGGTGLQAGGGLLGGGSPGVSGSAGALGVAGDDSGMGAGGSGVAGDDSGTGAGGDDSGTGVAGDDSGTDSGGSGGTGVSLSPDDVFRPSTRFTLVNPKDHGAKGDGTTDDAAALDEAFAAVPAGGGIVLFPSGTYLKDRRRLAVTKSHTLLWAPNRRATIHGTVRSLTEQERDDELCGVRQQALVFQRTVGGGVYGLRFTSNATERTSCAEDCQITLDTVDGMDIVGTEVDGASACGVFAWSSAASSRSQNLFVEGNFFHHTHADSIHHTHGARRSWCWRNYLFNAAPSLGDDGIACVTYSTADPRCGEMEWWGNFYLGGAHGRGMAVIGGEDISIHHNWVIGAAAAGLIVASESAYTSASSERIELRSNYIVDSPNGSVDNGHSSILISGGNAQADPIRAVESVANVIIGAPENRVERAEGRYDEATVSFDDTTDPMALPGPVPTLDDVRIEDTSVLRTRDVSFVEASARKALQRIHLREAATGAGIEERFEYVVSGAPSAISTWLDSARAQGIYLSESRTTGGISFALVLSPEPIEIPAELSAVGFEALREGDRSGALSWLWERLDRGNY